MKKLKIISGVSIFLIFIYACQKEIIPDQISETPVLPNSPYNYTGVMEETNDFFLPSRFAVPFQNNEEIFIDIPFLPGGSLPTMVIESDQKATLGRVLFYDKRLSKNNSISCASCHKQQFAFADNLSKSPGFGGELTSRNSMSISNPIVNNSFFWDSREPTLHSLSTRPITNHIEMGMENMSDLVQKLQNESYYQDLSKDAFGDGAITSERIATSLSQFVGSIFKKDSKFDEGIKNDFANFSEKEKIGMALFFSQKTQCASCHSGANFSAQDGHGGEYQQTSGTANIGLDMVYEDDGKGKGQFKIPSLRNIALTAPYMHDGRFATLKDVIGHYNDGVQAHHNLDDKLFVNGAPKSLNLTSLQIEALESFLHTLSSKTITTDERYANPFLP